MPGKRSKKVTAAQSSSARSEITPEEVNTSQEIVRKHFSDEDEGSAIENVARIAKSSKRASDSIAALDWLHKHKHASAFKTNAQRGTQAIVVRVISHGQPLNDVGSMEGIEVMAVQ